MESLLIKQDLSITLEGIAKKLAGMADEDFVKLVRASIFLSLSNNVLFNVTGDATTKEVWDRLSAMYEMASTTNKVFIMKRLYKLKMKEGCAMANHINEFNTLISQATSVGMTQDDESKAILLLCSLPSSWDGVVTAVSRSISGKNKLVFNDVAATLLSEDLRRKNDEPSSGEGLMVVSTDNRGRSHNRGRNNYHRCSKSAKRSKSRNRNGECWFCGKASHVKKDCKNFKRAQERV